MGVYVIVEAPGDYQRECFAQYGLKTDSSGKYAIQFRPYNLIGPELSVSIANLMTRGEPTASCQTFAVDVIATAKRDLSPGKKLDDEGDFMVYGELVPARQSLRMRGLPVGLAHGLVVRMQVRKDQGVSWEDVDLEGMGGEPSLAVKVRKEMKEMFRKEFGIEVRHTH